MRRNKPIIFLCLICILLIFGGGEQAFSFSFKDDSGFYLEGEKNLSPEKHFFQETEYSFFDELLDLEVVSFTNAYQSKGIYVNAWSAANNNRIEAIIDLINSSDLNSVVIDLKDVTGRISFIENDFVETPPLLIRDIESLIQRFHEENIYVIGRLVLFKDASLALKGPEYSLTYKLNNSDLFINSSKWANPYEKKVWNYNLDIAEKAIDLGIDEIKFDYIRFPTLASNSKLSIVTDDGKSKSDAIIAFLKHADYRLADRDIFISADVYGLTTTVKGDLNIGQDITKMINYLDFISPMIYPSHYTSGMYGIENPDIDPYNLIKRSLADAKDKLGEDSYKLRPWLQDFSMRSRYTIKEVEDQIRAVEELGIEGWLLWNPSSRYTFK